MSVRVKVRVIIPAYNEAESIGKVIEEIPEWVSEVIVANNGSTDHTDAVARKSGATVVNEPNKGYGSACLKAMNYIEKTSDQNTDIVVFLDGDYSDYPIQMTELIEPIKEDLVDFVIGSRSLGERARGSMTIPQVFGNWLATTLIKAIYNYETWLGRGFVLVAKNYIKLDNFFQAKATLESVIENVVDKDIKADAQSLLDEVNKKIDNNG